MLEKIREYMHSAGHPTERANYLKSQLGSSLRYSITCPRHLGLMYSSFWDLYVDS